MRQSAEYDCRWEDVVDSISNDYGWGLSFQVGVFVNVENRTSWSYFFIASGELINITLAQQGPE